MTTRTQEILSPPRSPAFRDHLKSWIYSSLGLLTRSSILLPFRGWKLVNELTNAASIARIECGLHGKYGEGPQVKILRGEGGLPPRARRGWW